MAGLINRVFGTAGAAAAPGQAASSDPQRVDVAVDTRSNSLIVRTENPSRLSRVQNLVASLDVPTPVAGNVHVIYLKNAEAAKVAQTLRGILSGEASMTQSGDGKTTTATTPGTTTGPGSVTGAGMVQADVATNALIVTAPEAVYNNIRAVVEKLDVRRA